MFEKGLLGFIGLVIVSFSFVPLYIFNVRVGDCYRVVWPLPKSSERLYLPLGV